MAVFGRNQVEPPGGGFFQRLVYFEVARFGVRHVAGAGVTGRPMRWSNGGCYIISGHGAHDRTAAKCAAGE
jgi:hypothetical protein